MSSPFWIHFISFSASSPHNAIKYFVWTLYLLLGNQKIIYTGITNDLENRLRQHKNGQSKFTKKFSDLSLIYTENYKTSLEAAKREKEIKGWNREKKMKLVKSFNRIVMLKSKE